MDDLPLRKLTELLATHGPALCEDSGLLDRLLTEACPEHPGEVRALVCAAQSGVPAALQAAPQEGSSEPWRELIQTLVTSDELPDEVATYAIATWARALGKWPAETQPATLDPAPVREWHQDEQAIARLVVPACLLGGVMGLGMWWRLWAAGEARQHGFFGLVFLLGMGAAVGLGIEKLLRRALTHLRNRRDTLLGRIFRTTPVAAALLGALTAGSVVFTVETLVNRFFLSVELGRDVPALPLWRGLTGFALQAAETLTAAVLGAVLGFLVSLQGRRLGQLADDLVARLGRWTEPVQILFAQFAFAACGASLAIVLTGDMFGLTSDMFGLAPAGQIVAALLLGILASAVIGLELPLWPRMRNAVLLTIAVLGSLWFLGGHHLGIGQERVLSGHEGEVLCVAITPDGSKVVSGGLDGTVRVWDLATGELLHTMEGHRDAVLSVAIPPEGRLALSGGQDGDVRLWDIETGTISRVWEKGPGKHSRKRYHGSAQDAFLRARDREPGSPNQEVRAVAFSHEGTSAFTTTYERQKGDKRRWLVRVWDTATGKQTARLRGDDGYLTCLCVAPDDSELAVGGVMGEVRFWRIQANSLPHKEYDLDTGNEGVGRIPAGTLFGTQALALSPDGKLGLSTGADHTIRLWDVETGQERMSRRQKATAEVRGLAFLPDGRFLTGDTDRKLRLFDATGKQLRRFSVDSVGGLFRGGLANVHAVAVAPDGKHAVIACRDGTLRVWRLPE